MTRRVRCAGAVVVADGRLLLVRRGQDPEAGRWSVPGGRLEPGEGGRAGAERETLEETGCRVVAGALCGTATIAAGEVVFEIEDFEAELADGQPPAPVAGSDAEAAAFLDRDEIEQVQLVAGLREWLVARGVLQRLRGSEGAGGAPVQGASRG